MGALRASMDDAIGAVWQRAQDRGLGLRLHRLHGAELQDVVGFGIRYRGAVYFMLDPSSNCSFLCIHVSKCRGNERR